MIVGALRVKVVLNDSRNLKDKRRILLSIKDRVRKSFNVSISEVSEQDMWNVAEIGVSVVGNETKFVNDVLQKVLKLIEITPSVYVVEREFETF